MSHSLNVIITGATKGIGRALSESFLTHNDSITICARTETDLAQTVTRLSNLHPTRVRGTPADVRNPSDVTNLFRLALEAGPVNAIFCNAGVVGRRAKLSDLDAEEIRAVVETNLLGSMYCAREAVRMSALQQEAIHVFLMDGSGTQGNATAKYAAYGATKRAVPQLVASLRKEFEGDNVRFHPMSPGMVLTNLLLGENVEPRSRKIFNFLADEPETVADELVPRLRNVVLADERKSYVRYLTIPRAAYRLLSGFLFGVRGGLFFDAGGKRVLKDGERYSQAGVRIKD